MSQWRSRRPLPLRIPPLPLPKQQDGEAPYTEGNDVMTGHIISTTIGGKNGEPKQTISYMAERVVGTSSFGIVFQQANQKKDIIADGDDEDQLEPLTEEEQEEKEQLLEENKGG